MSDVDQRFGPPVEPPYTPPPPPGPPGPGQPPASFDPPPPDEELAGPEPRRRSLGPHSLRARLVAGVTALVFVLVLLIGGGTWYALRYYLGGRLDSQLQQTADGSLTDLFAGIPARGDVVRGPQDVLAVALDSEGNVVTYPSDFGVERLLLSASDARRLARMGESSDPITVRTTDGQTLRVTTRPASAVNRGNGVEERAVAVIGLSTEEEQTTLNRLVSLEIIIGATALVVAFLATFYGVRFSLRRLRRVTDTAQEVAAELSPEGAGLGLRVPDDEPGTEVGQLATSFNMMLAAVQTQFAARIESENRMRQFMADASHELRTPLTSIRGYAELARMQRAAGDASDDNLHRIESEGTRMSRLVEDLLTLARGETDDADRPLRQELIDVAELIDDAVSSSRAAFPGRRIEVRVSGDPHVIGDPDQLLRVIRNLVTNAAIHTLPERPIEVRGFPDLSGVTIQVLDGGPGLPPEEAAHVFERFWRADKARTRARGGSGLGLSIVATIVRAHGGTARFDSSVETGSTVSVTLPGAHSDQD